MSSGSTVSLHRISNWSSGRSRGSLSVRESCLPSDDSERVSTDDLGVVAWEPALLSFSSLSWTYGA